MFLPTAKQFIVLEAVRLGKRNKEIAAQLGLSVPAVEYYMNRLFTLTATTNRVELALWWTDYRRVNPFNPPPETASRPMQANGRMGELVE